MRILRALSVATIALSGAVGCSSSSTSSSTTTASATTTTTATGAGGQGMGGMGGMGTGGMGGMGGMGTGGMSMGGAGGMGMGGMGMGGAGGMGMGGMGMGGAGGMGMGGAGGAPAAINACTAASATDLTGQAKVDIAFGGAVGLAYDPACIRVDVGTEITFNGDFSAHPLMGGTVDGAKATPDPTSPIAATKTGKSATFTFPKAGGYGFYCDFHFAMGMQGAVLVE